jgi:hypothetical protein
MEVPSFEYIAAPSLRSYITCLDNFQTIKEDLRWIRISIPADFLRHNGLADMGPRKTKKALQSNTPLYLSNSVVHDFNPDLGVASTYLSPLLRCHQIVTVASSARTQAKARDRVEEQHAIFDSVDRVLKHMLNPDKKRLVVPKFNLANGDCANIRQCYNYFSAQDPDGSTIPAEEGVTNEIAGRYVATMSHILHCHEADDDFEALFGLPDGFPGANFLITKRSPGAVALQFLQIQAEDFTLTHQTDKIDNATLSRLVTEAHKPILFRSRVKTVVDQRAKPVTNFVASALPLLYCCPTPTKSLLQDSDAFRRYDTGFDLFGMSSQPGMNALNSVFLPNCDFPSPKVEFGASEDFDDLSEGHLSLRY